MYAPAQMVEVGPFVHIKIMCSARAQPAQMVPKMRTKHMPLGKAHHGKSKQTHNVLEHFIIYSVVLEIIINNIHFRSHHDRSIIERGHRQEV